MSEEMVKQENTEQVKAVQEEIKEEVSKDSNSPEIKSESNKENWKKFREDRENERKARQEAERLAKQKHDESEALKAAMEALLEKNKPQQYQEQYQENDEDVIEKRIQIALEKERKKQEEAIKAREIAELPKKLNQVYRDFDKVCSTENLDYLEFHHPEIATPYGYMPNSFEKWSAIYQAVKKFVPQDAREEKSRIQENIMKPKNSVPSMPETRPGGVSAILTEEKKRANWERMTRERKYLS